MGASESIFTTQADSNTVNSLKVDVFRKWYIGCRRSSAVVNRVCPSWTIVLFIGFTPIFSHVLVFGFWQHRHVPHSPLNSGITWSPAATSTTPSPTLSTILQFGMEKLKSYNYNYNKKKIYNENLGVGVITQKLRGRRYEGILAGLRSEISNDSNG